MKKIALTLLLTFLSLNSWAGWLELSSDQAAVEYVNIETRQKTENIVKMWNMTNFFDQQSVGNGRLFKSSKALQEYDCFNNKKRMLTLIHFVDNMGQGQVAFMESEKSNWRKILPDTVGEMLLKAACDIN